MAYRRAARHHIHRRPGIAGRYGAYRRGPTWSTTLFWLLGIGVFVGLLAFAAPIWNSLSSSSGNSAGDRILHSNERFYETWSLVEGTEIYYSFSEFNGRRVEFLILNEFNAESWDSGEQYDAEVYFFTDALEGEFKVPYKGRWYVIIYNSWPEAVHIEYNIGYEHEGFLSPFIMLLILLLIFVGLIAFVIVKKRRNSLPQGVPRPPYPSTSSETTPVRTMESESREEEYAANESASKKEAVYLYPEKPQYQAHAIPTCYACGGLLDAENRFCSECGKPVRRCQVCRGAISYGDSLAACSFCGNEFHERHIKEWLKVTGECPVCRKRLTQANLTLG